jgi:hypothetical protein
MKKIFPYVYGGLTEDLVSGKCMGYGFGGCRKFPKRTTGPGIAVSETGDVTCHFTRKTVPKI